MGKKWDYDVPSVDVWREVLRVLKPGGHLLSFGGSRTYHRMVVNIEDAGFEIRDQIMWVYGSGFPKSRNIGKDIEKVSVGGIKNLKQIGTKQGIKVETGTQGYSYNKEYVAGKCMGGKQISGDIPVYEINNEWDGWGTALKPSHEPICLARKPLDGTVAGNVLKWGTGGINVDGCRVGTDDKLGGGMVSMGRPKVGEGWDRPWMHDQKVTERKKTESAEKVKHAETLGRFPANFIHDGSDEVVGLLPVTTSGKLLTHHHRGGGGLGGSKTFAIRERSGEVCNFGGDSGSAARFFYCAKASRAERGEGNNHPTVKPVKLMEYLVTLVTPPGGVCCDPFMGSGTTGLACRNKGFRFVGIDHTEDHCEIAKRRTETGTLFAASEE
jgi:site-specific DNA-methyltransferase (adenine-specific)